MRTEFLWGNLKQRDRWKDLGLGRRYNIKIYIIGICWETVGWIYLAQDRQQALVNAARTFTSRKMRGDPPS